MKKSTVIILGDSTSMTIGVELATYPFVLSDQNIWPTGTEFLNCSLPGFTAADACAYYFKRGNKAPNVSAVIIYLGNCDTMASEIMRGRYNGWKRILQSVSADNGKFKLKNRLLHFEWNDAYRPSIEAPEHPGDFEFNINRVVLDATSKGIPVVLVRPNAHVNFPAGIGKGNFLFYRYLGLDDKISDKLNIADERFKSALRLHEEREFERAMDQYKSILTSPGVCSGNPEYQMVVVNNYAVAATEMGRFDEADFLLRAQLKENSCRKEITLYNLAKISEMRGDRIGHEKLLAESFEADRSMYRVRSPYVKAIDAIAAKYRDKVSVVELPAFIKDDMFVDHCHPLPEGQILIANRIRDVLQSKGLRGDVKARIINDLFNPEFSLGNNTPFFAYFKACSGDSEAVLQSGFEDYRKNLQGNADSEWPSRIQYYLRHPMFGGIEDIAAHRPFHASDCGRFPEFFLVRSVIPYVKRFENVGNSSGAFDVRFNLLRSSKLLESILPLPGAGANSSPDNVRVSDAKARIDGILSRVGAICNAHVSQGNRVAERLKTTIYWYFRETLRYGSHSRRSMRYDRTTLEYCMEALIVAWVLSLETDRYREGDILRAKLLLERIVEIHEKYAVRFVLGSATSKADHVEYDRELRSLVV